MSKAKLGFSQRGYAKARNVSLSYVQRLIDRGVIIPLPDGSIDADSADLGRARNTDMGLGERRRRRASGDSPRGSRMCLGCGEMYSVADPPSPNPKNFCTKNCFDDVASGLTTEQIRAKMRVEGQRIERARQRQDARETVQ